MNYTAVKKENLTINKKKTLLMSADDVAACVDLDEVFEMVERVFRYTSEGQVILPPKLIMNIPADEHMNFIISGPADVLPLKTTGVKIITGFKDNPSKYNLPYIMSTMILIEHETGYPIAIIDGTHLTNARTGAMVAVAAKYLARQDASSIALIGAGTQARSSARALCRILPIKELRVCARHQDTTRKFKKEMSSILGLPIHCFHTAQDAIEGSDIIVTVTTSEVPIVMNKWVKPGSFIASVGTHQELDPLLVRHADKLVVDDKNQARYRGELSKGYKEDFITDSMIHADLGEVVSGIKTGRRKKDEINIACLTGIGTLDVAVSKIIYEKALKFNRGTYFSF